MTTTGATNMQIQYVSGIDVREPIGEGRKIIGHCCNDLGRTKSMFLQ